MHNSVRIFLGGVAVAALAGTALAFIPSGAVSPLGLLGAVASSTSSATSSAANLALVASSTETKPSVQHIKTPSAVKAIYMSQCVVGTPSFRDSLTKFIDDSELNAVVIDIRDYTGYIAFPTDNPELKDYVSTACGAHDMKAFVQKLHDKNIYVIGRITTFQNPAWTKAHPEQAVQSKKGGVWKDHKGLAFVDVGAKPYWDNVATLAKVSYEEMGFDEINFDYIRFPSDGDMSDTDYTWEKGMSKAESLERFFKYLHEQLAPTGMPISADVFGMVATNEDDLGIGQVLERALPYFDFVDPMVYPSHYPTGFNGYKDVNQHSYDIVNMAMNTAVARAVATSTKVVTLDGEKIMKTVEVHATGEVATTTTQVASGYYIKPSWSAEKIRPWLQSFDYPVTYTPGMVTEQIKATNDAGLNSWLFWDAANKYTSLRNVLATTTPTE